MNYFKSKIKIDSASKERMFLARPENVIIFFHLIVYKKIVIILCRNIFKTKEPIELDVGWKIVYVVQLHYYFSRGVV